MAKKIIDPEKNVERFAYEFLKVCFPGAALRDAQVAIADLSLIRVAPSAACGLARPPR